jgi:hypothetical protein
MTVGRTTQSNLPGQSIESSADLSTIQPITSLRNEQVACLAAGQKTFAAGNVVSEHLAGRSVQGYQTGLAELGASHRKETLLEINVLEFEVAGLTDTQAGYAQ